MEHGTGTKEAALRVFCGLDVSRRRSEAAVVDDEGRLLGNRRLSGGARSLTELCALLAVHSTGPDLRVEVAVRSASGGLAGALYAAGHRVWTIDADALNVYRMRDAERHGGSDAVLLANVLRVDGMAARQVREGAGGDQPIAALARALQAMVWSRQRDVDGLRFLLREFFPAALVAFPELAAAPAMRILGAAPTPGTAARLSPSELAKMLGDGQPASRMETDRVATILRAGRPRRPDDIEEHLGAAVTSAVASLAAVNGTIASLEESLDGLMDSRHVAKDAPAADGTPARGRKPASVPGSGTAGEWSDRPASGAPVNTTGTLDIATVGSGPPASVSPAGLGAARLRQEERGTERRRLGSAGRGTTLPGGSPRERAQRQDAETDQPVSGSPLPRRRPGRNVPPAAMAGTGGLGSPTGTSSGPPSRSTGSGLGGGRQRLPSDGLSQSLANGRTLSEGMSQSSNGTRDRGVGRGAGSAGRDASGELRPPTSSVPRSPAVGTSAPFSPAAGGRAGNTRRRRPVPDADGLPIFAEVQSAWFAEPDTESGVSNGASEVQDWTSISDDGWRAAEQATDKPAVEGRTASGLPIRRRGANLVPGSAPAIGHRNGDTERPRAQPELIRGLLSSYHHGFQRGRADAAAAARRTSRSNLNAYLGAR